MNKSKEKTIKRIRRHNRVRSKIQGTKECPRLNVFRSNLGVYVQLIDDINNKTIIGLSSKVVSKKDNKTNISFELGKLIGVKAQEQKIKKVVFDRGGYTYQGRVKSLAEGARESGLEF